MKSARKQQIKAKHINQKRRENCDNKKRYSNEVMAIATAYDRYEIGGSKELLLYYYKCNLCNGYHLTCRGGGSSVAIEKEVAIA